MTHTSLLLFDLISPAAFSSIASAGAFYIGSYIVSKAEREFNLSEQDRDYIYSAIRKGEEWLD